MSNHEHLQHNNRISHTPKPRGSASTGADIRRKDTHDGLLSFDRGIPALTPFPNQRRRATMTDQHTLTYQGLVDPPIDSIMGPGLGLTKYVKVLGSVYNEANNTTAVSVEEVDMNADPTNEERDMIVAVEAETQEDSEVRSIEDSEQEKYDHDEHFGRKP